MDVRADAAGDQRIDASIQSSLALLEELFPQRLRACYLSGSWVAGHGLPTSDIDLLLVFKGHLAPEEQAACRRALTHCSLRCGILLDAAVVGEEELLARGEVPAKTASRVLLAGEDIRRSVPPIAVEEFALQAMLAARFYLGHVRGDPPLLALPLAYPDPQGEFFGYERRGLRTVHGWDQPGTKAFVGAITFAATSVVALRAGRCPVRCEESVAAYRAAIADEWTSYLEEVVAACKSRWAHRVPTSGAERRHLRTLCAQALAFENHFARTCTDHVPTQLDPDDGASVWRALRWLARVDDPRERVLARLRALLASDTAGIRREAATVLQAYGSAPPSTVSSP